MAQTYVPIPHEEPSGAIRHLRSSAWLASILILAFAFAACGGDDGDGTSEVQFASVSAGYFHTCGVRRDGSVECWGSDLSGQATPPSGEFASVSGGGGHTCGVRRDGSAECWGDDEDFDGNEIGQATPPSGEFASVSAGWTHTCGLRLDGSVECWAPTSMGNPVSREAPSPR